MGQLSLLRTRRFAGIFWTQFFGAFNDNLLKNALVILITYRSLSVLGLSSENLVALCGGLFILPFFLFSATAGELADRFAKHHLVRAVKVVEIGIMAAAAFGFWRESVVLLLAALFLMGVHSSVFGPVKYSILPQLLTPEELVGGNALVEMGTFLAILLGTIGGGFAVSGGATGLAAAGHDVAGKHVLLCGAGGAGAAIAFALVKHGCASLAIENRTRLRAELLAARIGDVFPYGEVSIGVRPGATYDVAVNATSLGMHDGDPLPMSDATIDASALVAECVVTREVTPLLEAARARGRAVHGGLAMLEAQIELLLDFMGVGPGPSAVA